MNQYSVAEWKLIEVISSHWKSVAENTTINPPNLYSIMAEEAFIKNLKGEPIDALRRVCGACKKCSPYRMTPEFDKLCEFSNPTIYI